MVQIRWTNEAELWLKDIYEYISKDKPYAAFNVINGIMEKVKLLEDFPDIGYKFRTEKEGEIRILLYGHYRIAYLRHNTKDFIDILGVFHGSLDINRYFIRKD